MASEIYGYHKENDIPSNYYPQNTHLAWEDSLYGIYFVRHDNNKILEKTTDKGLTTSTVTTRTNKDIARGWHDKINHIIYLCDCEYDDSVSYIWSIDLSDDSIEEIESVPASVYDIWRYNNETYIFYFTGTGDYELLDEEVLPEGDIQTDWDVTNAPNHWDDIDENHGSLDTADRVYTNVNAEQDEFSMATIDMRGYGSVGVDQVYQIKCWVNVGAYLHDTQVIVSGNKVGLDAETFDCSTVGFEWKSVVWSGLSLDQADLDDLQITVESKLTSGYTQVSALYCIIYFYGDGGTLAVIRNLDTTTNYTNSMGMTTGRSWDISQVTIVGTDFHFNWVWSDSNVEHWRFQTGDSSFDQLVADCGATTEMPSIQQHALSYDDVSTLFFVLGIGTVEVSTILAKIANDIADESYIAYSAMDKNATTGVYEEKDYYIWFDKAGDSIWTADPGGRTNIRVPITAGWTAQQVSDSIESSINAITIITCDNAAGLTNTLTNHYNGDTSAIIDVDSGLTVATTIPGISNVYYLYTWDGTTLTKKGEYNIALTLNRSVDSALTPAGAFQYEKAFHITKMRVYAISRSKGHLNFIANWLTSIDNTEDGDFPNTVIRAITDSYVIIDKTGDGGNIELWEYVDVMNTLVFGCIINTEERMRPSLNLNYLKKKDYSDPPTKDQFVQIFGKLTASYL